MAVRDVSLHDKFDLERKTVLLNGTQALVRLMLMQKARDRAAGLNTAGYVTGYRGSPLGAVDQQMQRAEADLKAADILFQEGLNEDLAATALWGAQQAELRGEGRFDGVFGLWYGKGPGVDRSGDVMRHANMAGTSPNGGVIMAMGDDHTGESSTTLHQSDWAMVDAYMPVLSPAGVQEILDYGLYGYALSRFAGVWVGLKLMKDTVEVTSVVDGDPARQTFVVPEFAMPEGGLNIRLIDDRVPQEARMVDFKRHAAEAFARANGIDKRVWGKPGARIGFVAAGKNWLDLVHALSLLGIDADNAAAMDITTYKVGQVWPLDMAGFRAFARDLDLIVVVEEKRKLIEVQIKEALFESRANQRVLGAQKDGATLFDVKYALDPVAIAKCLGKILIEEGRGNEGVEAGLTAIAAAEKADNAPQIASRVPYFCSGCPHNTSTRLPAGARAYAGIGCHYMVQWMDRETVGFTQMGGEGANWIGEAPFSTRGHVFQNIGDGTYNHSGIQAIRAAVSANTTMTYKILFNDAVAMTGGQKNDGSLDAARIAHEVTAMGVRTLAVVHDDKEAIDWSGFPPGARRYPREKLIEVEEMLQAEPGVTVLLYIQTCAAEKRRRRKRGQFPDPDRRVFINTDICEGCGDCGVQSNCVAIVPVETELGRKRAIDQSSCNKDFSCLSGFCPSFVTLSGGRPRRAKTMDIDLGGMAEPSLPAIRGTHNIVITGVGGTGVVTIGAVLAMAAHLDGKGAGMMEMAGLAQKGGAVHIHFRLANRPEDISAIRVATGECDTLIGGDLVVSAGARTLGLMRPGRAAGVVNSQQIVTGEFTRNTDFHLPAEELTLALQARLGERLRLFDAGALARLSLGDTIFSNMIVLGAAWQLGQVPLDGDAIRQAIRLNGAAVEGNLRAFEVGRWAAMNPEAAGRAVASSVINKPLTLEEKIDFRAERLAVYQDRALADRYRARLERIADGALRAVVAESYFRLLAYKDEYEVARMLQESRAKAEAEFEGDLKLTYHLAPPFLPGRTPDGRPRKRGFGELAIRMMAILPRFKRLRGTPFDPFGYSAERRMERAMIRDYEADLDLIAAGGDAGKAALALAGWPQKVRGYGPVKAAARAAAMAERATLLAVLGGAPGPVARAAE